MVQLGNQEFVSRHSGIGHIVFGTSPLKKDSGILRYFSFGSFQLSKAK